MYFVVLPDGQKFGPADLSLLNQWVSEGRVLATTTLEDAQTGQRITANMLPGLQVATTQPNPYPAPGTMNPPQNYSNYYRPGMVTGDNGQQELTMAYVFGAIGLAMCAMGGGYCSIIGIIFPILGLVYAKKAQDKGNPSANTARVISIVGLILQAIGLVIGGFIVGLGFLGGF